MTADRRPAAFMTSLAFHALVVAVILLFSYTASLSVKAPPKIFELVRGEGRNIMATEAPKLGEPGGVKLTVPAPPTPKPQAPEKVEPAPTIKPESTPVASTPPPKATATKAPPLPPSPAKKILTQLKNAENRAKREVAKERKEEQDRMTKAEFDRLKKTQVADKAATAKIKKIDGEGIAKGVEEGSTANKDGGAGGKALTANEGSALERYFSKLKLELEKALEKPAGISDALIVTVEFHLAADGTISGVRVTKPSGSREFDDAVRAAFRRVGSIGPRPDGKGEVLELNFKAKELDGE